MLAPKVQVSQSEIVERLLVGTAFGVEVTRETVTEGAMVLTMAQSELMRQVDFPDATSAGATQLWLFITNQTNPVEAQ